MIPITLNRIKGTDVMQSNNVAGVVKIINNEIIITGHIPITNTHNNVVTANNVFFNNFFMFLFLVS